MLSGFTFSSTFPPQGVNPDLGPTLEKGKPYTVLVLCFNETDTKRSSDFTYIDLMSLDNVKVSAVATALAGPPLALVIASVVVSDQVALSISWSAPLDQGLGQSQTVNILNFSLQISQAANFSQIDIATNVAGSQRSTQIQGLIKGRSYYCRIRALTAAGAGDFSDIVGPQTALGLPVPPVILSSMSGRGTSGLYVQLTWQLPGDTGDSTSSLVLIDQYQVQVSNYSNFDAFVFLETIIPDQSLSAQQQQQKISFDSSSSQSSTLKTMIQRSLGTIIYLRVRARSAKGWSEYSSVQHQIVGGSPGLPEDVVLVVYGSLSFNLSWNPPKDKDMGPGNPYPLLRYVVRIKDSNSIESVQTVSATTTYAVITNFADSPLVRGEKYSAEVQAVNDLGASAFASSVNSVGFAVGISTPPANVVLCSYGGGSSCMIGTSSFPDSAGPLKLRSPTLTHLTFAQFLVRV